MSIEAMKQALEALENIDRWLPTIGQRGLRDYEFDAICALRQAIEQAEKQEPLEYWNAVEGWVKIDEVRQHFDSVGCGTIYKNAGEDRVPLYATPQPQQAEKRKPTAWIYKPHRELLWPNEVECTTPIEKNEYEPLYNIPQPEREWVALTDAEIDSMVEVTDLSGAYYYDDLYAVARAIEAKLKEKNT